MSKMTCCVMMALIVPCIDAVADVATYYTSITSNPQALYAFFKKMPKGGELHYHFSGSAYPEDLITQVRRGSYCINPTTFELTRLNRGCNGVNAKKFLATPLHYHQTVRAWSMDDSIVTQASQHDHFFSVFSKTNPVYTDFYLPLLADMMRRAAKQHELYMEIILFSSNDTASYEKLIQSVATLSDKKRILLGNPGVQQTINHLVNSSHVYLNQVHHELGCDVHATQPVCSLRVRFQYLVKREASLDAVFAQALIGFTAAERSQTIVGVNLVQPENGTLSSRDFDAQMHVFNWLHATYPTVHIALHAGELGPNEPLHDLRCHIHDAIHIGHAERIGHGVDISHEDNHSALVNYMAKKHIAVEINFTSNRRILGVYGNHHPVLYYLKHGVPLVLSTDDEGILHTDLTQQYVDAARIYGMDYPTIKAINRNALTYSFLPGKSIWADPAAQRPVPACRDRLSVACSQFIQTSEKARLQWELEHQLTRFESSFF